MTKKEDRIFGLTTEEVNERIKNGEVNKVKSRKTKTYREIFLKNIFTVFNCLIIIMTILILPTMKSIGDIGNISFAAIAFLNLIIGIIQEIKAKHIVDKLILVDEAKIKVMRNLELTEISASEIVLGDTCVMSEGKQIPCDMTVLVGEISVNESNVTGESDDIVKKKGDFLYSGSFVVSGECFASATAVGSNSFIEKLSAEASTYKKPKSEIMNTLSKIITTISIILIPMSIALFLIYYGYDVFQPSSIDDLIIFGVSRQLILGVVSSINGMIPYGLFLLTSMSLAVSVIKLATEKTLVQDLYCIEQLARVDVLCLDKTGTITDGSMKVKDIILVENEGRPEDVAIISSINGCLNSNNQTSMALKDRFGKTKFYTSEKILNFNSTNKYSAVTFKEIGTYAIGAPEILLRNSSYKKVIDECNSYATKGLRVIVLARTDGTIENNTVNGTFIPEAIITIKDNIRKGAKDTLKLFRENGVEIKVISGDNPVTVSAIAMEAGVLNAEKYISLDNLTDEEVEEAALNYTIFGRVKPNQKKIIVQTLKKNGHKVAMTGDGVNDILALREADCSIVMATGSDAVKGIAHLVLLDSNFLALPSIVNEGRRVINNIQRSSALYLSKTLLMFLINITAIIMYFVSRSTEFTSPFKEPSQLELINLFVIGFPSFVLALEPNHERIKGKFINNILINSVPGALIVFLNLLFLTLFSNVLHIDSGSLANLEVLAASFAFYMVIVYISVPFSKIRLITALVSLGLMIVVPFVTIITYKFIGFNYFGFSMSQSGNLYMNFRTFIYLLIMVAGSAVLYGIACAVKLLSRRKENETR